MPALAHALASRAVPTPRPARRSLVATAAAPADAVGPLSRRAALAAGLAAGVLALSPAR
jgi:hypothetical protein